MASSNLQAICLAAVLLATVLAVRPVMADKPAWAGNNPGGKQGQDFRGPERRDYSGRESRDRDYDRRRDWSGDRHYRDQPHKEHAEWRNAPRYGDRDRPKYGGGRYFVDQHRTYVHDYYHDNYRGRHCPPGLAKKRNGCVPPGHARKWAIGRPLPRNVIFYDLPPAMIAGIGYPPPGYRFVRVASDILLIAIGTGMVMDAIYDLGGGW
ncbi:MAG: hypothetical protein ACU83V_01820 [Gammaproteobacteria bacterium]